MYGLLWAGKSLAVFFGYTANYFSLPRLKCCASTGRKKNAFWLFWVFGWSKELIFFSIFRFLYLLTVASRQPVAVFVKNCFLMSNLKDPSCRLKPLALVLSIWIPSCEPLPPLCFPSPMVAILQAGLGPSQLDLAAAPCAELGLGFPRAEDFLHSMQQSKKKQLPGDGLAQVLVGDIILPSSTSTITPL